MNDGNPKQKIVEKINSNTNILVTVSDSPSVDELCASLGLTILLNKLDKHATAVVSGELPPAITFLDAAKTFEHTIDSLRDFIIALDKEKADHLRYKVEGDVVKIYITPYRTTITKDDLEFSQGDYNVGLVLALGVTTQAHLDRALEAHGRILHDATVITMGAGNEKSSLGSIDWREQDTGSISEMIVNLADALKTDKPLMDEQIATALMTGIVAATDRFSNEHTTSKTMSVAAKLMGAGANQQLIAQKLQEALSKPQATVPAVAAGATPDTPTTDLQAPQPVVAVAMASDDTPASVVDSVNSQPVNGNDSIGVAHDKPNLDEVAKETADADHEEAAREAEAALAEQLETVKSTAPSMPATPSLSVADIQKDIEAAHAEVDRAAEQAEVQPSLVPAPGQTPEAPSLPPAVAPIGDWQQAEAPVMGGTLNATTAEAEEAAREQLKEDQSRPVLSHDDGNSLGFAPGLAPGLAASMDSGGLPSLPGDPMPEVQPPMPVAPDAPPPMPEGADAIVAPSELTATDTTATLADIDAANRETPVPEDARDAVQAAFEAFAPSSVSPSSTTGMPPMPDFTTLPPVPPVIAAGEVGPAVDTIGGGTPAPESTGPGSNPPAPSDPAHFRIPGQ